MRTSTAGSCRTAVLISMLKAFLILMVSCRDMDDLTLRWTLKVMRRILDFILFNWEPEHRGSGANGESSSAHRLRAEGYRVLSLICIKQTRQQSGAV